MFFGFVLALVCLLLKPMGGKGEFLHIQNPDFLKDTAGEWWV
jgi:hypothetical protein